MSDFIPDPTLPLTEGQTSKFEPNPEACVDISDKSCETCEFNDDCILIHEPDDSCDIWTPKEGDES